MAKTTSETANKARAKKNAKFKRMSKAEQRVAIAKDALAQVVAEKLRASPGTYCEVVTRKGEAALADAGPETQLRNVDYGKCDVCAIGAMFLGKARVFDKVTVEDMSWATDWHSHLEPYFSEGQLCLIEAAFEMKDCSPLSEGQHLVTAAIAFGARRRSSTTRLKDILQNIIDNKGTFCPEQGDAK